MFNEKDNTSNVYQNYPAEIIVYQNYPLKITHQNYPSESLLTILVDMFMNKNEQKYFNSVGSAVAGIMVAGSTSSNNDKRSIR